MIEHDNDILNLRIKELEAKLEKKEIHERKLIRDEKIKFTNREGIENERKRIRKDQKKKVFPFFYNKRKRIKRDTRDIKIKQEII